MKKLLSVLLALSMLLTFMVVPLYAADGDTTLIVNGTSYTVAANAVTVGEGDSAIKYDTVSINGVTYLVIRTADQFAAITGTYNYVLADDINLNITGSGNYFSVVKSDWTGILEGNGKCIYGLTMNSANASGIFSCTSDGNAPGKYTVNATIQNITMGKEDAPIVINTTGNGGSGVFAGKTQNGIFTFKNVTVYVNITATEKANQGAFLGVMQNKSGTYTFENCKAYGTIDGMNKLGGFVGCVESEVKAAFENCVNNVNVNGGKQGVAGFVGHSAASSVQLTFDSCVNNGTITANNIPSNETASVGGFVGQLNSSFSSCTIKLCTNNGSVATSTNVSGATLNGGSLVGLTDCSGTLSILVPAGTSKDSTGMVGKNSSTTKTFEVAYPTYTLDPGEDGAPVAYYQTTTAVDGKQDVRVIICVPSAKLTDIAAIDVNIKFGLTTSGTKTLALDESDVCSYSSIVAGNDECKAPDGYVFFAVVVENVVVSEWNQTVNVEISAEDAGGNMITDYTYNSAAGVNP